MKTIIALLLFTSLSYGQFIPKDKQIHLAAGGVISGVSYLFFYDITKDKKKAFYFSLGTATLAGVGKEVLDSTKEGNKFDINDLAFTIIGGLTVVIPFDLFFKNKKL
ncbi:MAG: hypothetical protein QM499_00975 [Flavobacteriaceae bacterium]